MLNYPHNAHEHIHYILIWGNIIILINILHIYNLLSSQATKDIKLDFWAEGEF